MLTARIRFHPLLVPLLYRRIRGDDVLYRFRENPSVKDAIEACGIPHTEVDVILVNGTSVTFEHHLRDSDTLLVYPLACSPDAQPLVHLSPALPQEPTFILDVHLGKLARRLRLLGFDCRYSNDCDDPELIRLALLDQRVLLTRDRGILKHARVQYGLLIRSSDADQQVREVLQRYRLSQKIAPFRRCASCNGKLEPIEKNAVRHRLLPRTTLYYHRFFQCRECCKLYWKGSHYHRIASWIDQMRHC